MTDAPVIHDVEKERKQGMTIQPITSYQLDRETDDYRRVTLYVAVCGSECSPAYEWPCLAMAFAYMEGWQ